MEGYKSQTIWNYSNGLQVSDNNRNNMMQPMTPNMSNSHSKYTNSSDSYSRDIHSQSPNKNPLQMNFHNMHANNRFNRVEDSLERSEKLKKRNFASHSDYENHQTSILHDENMDKYTILLHKMKPSLDLIEKVEPLVGNSRTIGDSQVTKSQSHPDLNRQPTKSVLISKNSIKPTLRKEKTVGFSDCIDVVEVENWKIYNVDMAKKVSRARNGKVCIIF